MKPDKLGDTDLIPRLGQGPNQVFGLAVVVPLHTVTALPPVELPLCLLTLQAPLPLHGLGQLLFVPPGTGKAQRLMSCT